jgi:hypothetical protein
MQQNEFRAVYCKHGVGNQHRFREFTNAGFREGCITGVRVFRGNCIRFDFLHYKQFVANGNGMKLVPPL